MSSSLSVYLGPFAEWLVPEAKYADVREKWQALVEEFQVCETGCLDFDPHSYTREVTIAGKRFIRECWTAFFGLAASSAEPPPRKFSWYSFDDVGEWEFSGFDTEGEKQWFRETFAHQLWQLAEAYGGEPTIKWGVVAKFV